MLSMIAVFSVGTASVTTASAAEAPGVAGIAKDRSSFAITQTIDKFVSNSIAGSLLKMGTGYLLDWVFSGKEEKQPTVKDAIEMGARRIGHGHHVYENPELSRYCADHGIALEICPTSNIQCKTRESYGMHPAYNLYALGVPITINTDNMTMARVNLEDEYDHCVNEMGFEYEDLILMNINSIKYSFLPEQDKKRIIAKLENCLDTLI